MENCYICTYWHYLLAEKFQKATELINYTQEGRKGAIVENSLWKKMRKQDEVFEKSLGSMIFVWDIDSQNGHKISCEVS